MASDSSGVKLIYDMKVKISYQILITKEIELTPEEFSNFDYNPRSRPDLYHEKAWGIKIKIADKESELQYLDWKFK